MYAEKSVEINSYLTENILNIVFDYDYVINNNYNYLCMIQSVYNKLCNHFNNQINKIHKSFFGVSRQHFYNQNKEREKSVIINYTKSNIVLENLIEKLSENSIKCYIFGDTFNESLNKTLPKNIINIDKSNQNVLNEYFNKAYISISSNACPTRIDYEMFMSGLCVFVTNYIDLPENIFNKLSNTDNDANFDKIKQILDDYNYTYDELYAGYLNIHNELDNLLNCVIKYV